MDPRLLVEAVVIIVGIAGIVVGMPEFLRWIRSIFFRRLSWKDIDTAIKKVQPDIIAAKPDVVVGISDGIVPGAIIALNLRIPALYWLDMPIIFDEGKRQTTITGDVGDLTGKTVLVVDNHIYTGTNMKAAVQFLETKNPRQIKTLVLFKQTVKTLAFEPDFYAFEVSGEVKRVPWGFREEHYQAYRS